MIRMARIKLNFDCISFAFRTELEVRIIEINYGRHMGNDALLGLLHEARLRFLEHHGFSEADIGGVGLLMGDAVIQFKTVALRGDRLAIEVGLQDLDRRTFDIVYRVTRISDGAVIALAKTGMVAFDYSRNRLAEVPEAFRKITENSSI